eukprot:13039850-Alexandrium_andersonii.AAC.1
MSLICSTNSKVVDGPPSPRGWEEGVGRRLEAPCRQLVPAGPVSEGRHHAAVVPAGWPAALAS